MTSTSFGDQGCLGFIIFDFEIMFGFVLLPFAKFSNSASIFRPTVFKKMWSNLGQVYEGHLFATLTLFSAVLEEGVLMWALK